MIHHLLVPPALGCPAHSLSVGGWSLFAGWASAQAQPLLIPGEPLRMCRGEGHWHSAGAEAGGDGETTHVCLSNLPGWVKPFLGAAQSVLSALCRACVTGISPAPWLCELCSAPAQSTAGRVLPPRAGKDSHRTAL